MKVFKEAEIEVVCFENTIITCSPCRQSKHAQPPGGYFWDQDTDSWIPKS